MTNAERKLCLAGLGLFLLALMQGFFIPLFERVDVARAAHATALGSGTFLIAVGLLWPKLVFSPRSGVRWAMALVVSLYAIAAGLTLMSTFPAGGEAEHRVLSLTSSFLNAGGAVALVVSMIAVILGFRTPSQ